MRFGKIFLMALITGSLFLGTEKAEAYNQDGRVHFEADFEALDRDVTEESVRFLNTNFPSDTVTAESLRLLAKLSVRIVDPVEVYGLVGGSNLTIDDFGYHADFGGAYGGGARVALYREDGRNPFEIFADYRFLTFKTHDTVEFAPTADLNGDGIIQPNEVLTDEILKEQIRWAEHSIKFGVMGRYDEVEPYGGVRFSLVRGKDFIPSQAQPLHVRFKQTDTFGVFAGVSYYLSRSDRAALFVEGSLFDQYSLAGGVRVGF